MPSSSVSSSSSTGALPSPSADAAATAPVSMSSIPMVDSLTPFDQSADVGQEFGHGDPAMFSAQAGGDGDSDTSFWDIIADSHMKLESYGDMPFDQEMTEPVASLLSPCNLLIVGDISFGMLMTSPPLGLGNHASSFGLVPTRILNFTSRQNGTPFRTKS
ncbi:hypothetical protein PsorP6_005316 [Peronosclerospora sorghi]|uniref:Uncharacterized protein n=1 Tax=Peronosclerospora sorghi TaxID=230839 RepID=A0ACC0W2Y1_9STRA|nr:hypothetical protein PsorP6_005316 [Peronosclerospora sorghi]